MDRFIIDKTVKEIIEIANRGGVPGNASTKKHFCSLEGIIETADGKTEEYRVLEGGCWKEVKKIAIEHEESDWGILFQLRRPQVTNGEAMVLASFVKGRLKATPIGAPKEITSAAVYRVTVLLLTILDYVQGKAMKEKHRIEKARRRAQKEGQATTRALSTSAPIKITSGIQYSYVYEERTEPVRHMLCELWSVRGHYRHYKSGKASYIAPYQKGKARKEKIAPGHVYEIVEAAK